ncbi:S24 family peptidase [Duganella sp. FT135W]|uniref:S24 family peptidase n=1 Tax=Duganella flavida TaxID=2692175 RepID=A0A6L8KEC8_9BURK|nr:S24 family peptidase [Duganella flavida]MYM25756.1 S24 family peptidase [Duganella flavida]
MKTNDEIRRQNLLGAIERYRTAAKLAEAVGTSAAYLSQIKNQTPESKTGKPKTMGDDLARRIEQALGEAHGWMDAEHEQLDLATVTSIFPDAVPVVAIDSDADYYYQIPLVKLRLQAGMQGVRTEPEYQSGGKKSVPRDWADREGLNPSRLVAIQVKGESMEPTLYEGDTIVINLADTKLVDNAIYAINYEGEAVVKRISRDAGQWWLMSDNADQRRFHRRACRSGECIVVGRVVRREGSRF